MTVVAELQDLLPRRILQPNVFALVIQVTTVNAGHVQARPVTRSKRCQVANDDRSGAWPKIGHSAAAEVKFDPVGKPDSHQAERDRADVFHFDEFKFIRARYEAGWRGRRMIHDLAHA